MPPEGIHISPQSSLILLSFFTLGVQSSVLVSRTDDDPLPITEGHLYNKTYLPAQIGGIVGAYAVSLVLVAIALLALSRRRRDHLANGNEEVAFDIKQDFGPGFVQPQTPGVKPIALNTQNLNPENYIGQDLETERGDLSPWIAPSPVSSLGAPGVSIFVDQNRVRQDRNMAQSQLEEMYKHVLEHEDAKQRGIVYEVPSQPDAAHQHNRSTSSFSSLASPKRTKAKPAGLSLHKEKTQSRTSSLLSALRSPGKKAPKCVSISSPIMTPQSATFPRQESQEMSAIPPRHYAPAPPPPCPPNAGSLNTAMHRQPQDAAEVSPESTLSIDQRIGSQISTHNRSASHAHTEGEPESATSEHSQAALVGLPTSPKPGARFSMSSRPSLQSLPASPKPGQTFQRSTPPAVRSGGGLPLRAYEPVEDSRTVQHTTKQTVFERRAPLSPGVGMTPFTGTAVPYSPYQPFTPCVPMTPSLVTKADRKRMKRMVPKTPTMNLVKSEDEVW